MIDDASMDTKFLDIAQHYGPTPKRTDTAAYGDAIYASKKSVKTAGFYCEHFNDKNP